MVLEQSCQPVAENALKGIPALGQDWLLAASLRQCKDAMNNLGEDR